MPDPFKQLQKLTNFLDKSVEDFSKDLPGVQTKMFNRVQVLLKDLELSRGSVKASVKNLRKIISLTLLRLVPIYRQAISRLWKRTSPLLSL